MVWGPKVRGPMGQGLFHCFTSFFHHFLWLADKFPLDNFPPDNPTAIGNLSSLEDVQGEIENLSTWELVHLGGNMSTQEHGQGEFPNPALKGHTETLQMTNIPQMLAVHIQ